jgi:hypothetical protein
LGIGVLAIAGAAGTVFGPAHAYAGCVAVGLCVLPAAITVWGTGELAVRSRYGGLAGMAAGTLVRTVMAVGGGAAAYWSVPAFCDDLRFEFWGWVLGVYVVTLAVETAVLARYFLASAAGKGNAA